MIRPEEALEYHANPRPGKIELRATKSCLTAREMRLAYLPGAAFPCEAIAADPAASRRFTSRGNLVAVITNGTAVPGLGDIGPAAAKPMQEGMALLCKRLADIDAFDLELDTRDPDAFVEPIRIVRNYARLSGFEEGDPPPFIECIATIYPVKGHATPMTPGAKFEYEVPDMFGRPWAHLWEEYFENGMQRPTETDIFNFDKK
jgi:malic enzyme